jgi:hypothetical protein
MASWVLIFTILTSNGGVSTVILPGFTKKACEWAAARAQYEIQFGDRKAICVKQTGDGKATKDE